jgi:hypothetical protein
MSRTTLVPLASDAREIVAEPGRAASDGVQVAIGLAHGLIEGVGAADDVTVELDVEPQADGRSRVRFRFRSFRRPAA